MRRTFFSLIVLVGVACRAEDPRLGQQEGMSLEQLTEAEADAVLEVVNTATLQALDVDAALDKRAAENIVAHRDGPDAALGTGDDDPIDDLLELDAIPQVGPSTITKLVIYAQSLGLVEEEGDYTPGEVAAILGVANTASVTTLDIAVELDKRAAENIVAHRVGPDGVAGNADDDPFGTLGELDDVPYVGESSLDKLLAYAGEQPSGGSTCLVISEYLEGDAYTDAVELYNCGTSPIERSEIGVCLVRNADTTCTLTNKLDAGALAPGDVWTLCRTKQSVTWLPSFLIAQNCRQVMPGVMTLSGDDRLLVFHDLDDDGEFDANADAALDAFGAIAVKPPYEWWVNMDLRRCNLEPFDGLNATEFERWDYFQEFGDGETEHYGVPPTGDGCP